LERQGFDCLEISGVKKLCWYVIVSGTGDQAVVVEFDSGHLILGGDIRYSRDKIVAD
jgi:hypothetical protein